jgi:hypothetical protein
MKRVAPVLIAGVLGLGLCAAPAFASHRSYNGSAGSAPHSGVEFGLHLKKGHPLWVYRFELHNVPAQCQGSGTTAVTEKLDITMNINAKRKFAGHESLNGGKVTVNVHGRFAKDFSKGHGDLRVHGTVPGCKSADTGVVTWSAHSV